MVADRMTVRPADSVALTVKSAEAKVHHRIGDVDEPGWNAMMDVNVKSTFFAVRRIAEIIIRRPVGPDTMQQIPRDELDQRGTDRLPSCGVR